MNYYRSDDVCSIAFLYLDKPVAELPAIESAEDRVYNPEQE